MIPGSRSQLCHHHRLRKSYLRELSGDGELDTRYEFHINWQRLGHSSNCSCGSPAVASEYGLFHTYVVVGGKWGNLSGVALDFNTSADLLQEFNPDVVWADSQVTQYAFIPVTGTRIRHNVGRLAFLAVARLHLKPYMVQLQSSSQ